MNCKSLVQCNFLILLDLIYYSSISPLGISILIETALLSVEGTSPHYNIILYTENGMDNIEVDVEVNSENFSDQVKELECLQKRITHAIESLIGLRVKVKLVAPNLIQRSEGKAKRVFDRRVRA